MLECATNSLFWAGFGIVVRRIPKIPGVAMRIGALYFIHLMSLPHIEVVDQTTAFAPMTTIDVLGLNGRLGEMMAFPIGM